MSRCFNFRTALLIAFAVTAPAWADKLTSGSKTAVPTPPLPSIRALKLEPASLTLKDGHDERRVLVWGKTDGGQWLDLTSQAAEFSKAEFATVPTGATLPT